MDGGGVREQPAEVNTIRKNEPMTMPRCIPDGDMDLDHVGLAAGYLAVEPSRVEG